MLIRYSLCLILLSCLFCIPAASATILQGFWWDCQNESFYARDRTYEYEWYNYLREQLLRLEEIGITALWTPPPCKAGNTAGGSMGYDIYDHYDLGEKPYNQPPSKPDGRTRFGTRNELLRLVSSAHAHGIGIYPDIVLNHMSGGKEDSEASANHQGGNRWKRFVYSAAGGSEAGRWPKGWRNFHPNPDHDTINTNELDAEMWGPDICYLSNSDANGHKSDQYMLKQAGDWFEWFSRVTGVDGYRFDAIRHYEAFVVRDLLQREEKVRDRKPFAVGEYGTSDTADLDRWTTAVDRRSTTFDFPLHDQLFKMVRERGLYNIGKLPDFLQKDAACSVTFVNSHDTVRGAAGNHMTIPPGDPWTGPAYAFILSLDRTPCVFYEDLFPNRSVQERRYGDPVKRPARQWLADLIKIRETYGSGPEPARFPLRTEDLLAVERPGKMITIINDNGADWKQCTFTSSFGPGVKLKDITSQTDIRVTTSSGTDSGKISIWVPPVSYIVLVPANAPPLAPLSRAPYRTLQEIEFADDLSTGTLCDKPREFRFWPAPGSKVNASLALNEAGHAQVDLLDSDGKPCKVVSPFNGKQGTWTAGARGWHVFRVQLNKGERSWGILSVDYMGE